MFGLDETHLYAGLFGTLIGGFITHRLALFRDKRKEFNTATHSIRVKAYALSKEISKGAYSHISISSEEIDNVVAVIGIKRSDKIVRNFNEFNALYKEACKTVRPSTPLDPQPMNSHLLPKANTALNNLIRELKPK